MFRTRLSLVVVLGSLLSATLTFGGCNQNTATPEKAPDPAPTTNEPNEPVPGDDDDTTKDPDEAPVPEVTAIAPKKATVGSVGPSIVVTGNNFVPRSIVQLDGAPLATTFIGVKELRATIPSNKLTTVAELRISVGTAPPGGGASKEVTFSVENPHPEVTALSPLSVLAGTGTTTLAVTGTDFVTGSKIVFGSTDLATTFDSATSLSASIPASLLKSSGSVPVTVVSPTPGGGTSTSIAFTVSNPDATVTSISPSTANVNGAAFEMTVTGTGFVNGSSVLFNGTSLTTTYQGSTKLKASVPAASLTAAGDVPITVFNPPPPSGGTTSAPVVFHVQYPLPSISAVNPNNVAAGSAPTVITVTGTDFYKSSQVTFNDAPAATTFVDSTHVKATASALQLASAKEIAVRVVNPSPGGGPSSALTLTVANGAPTITSLDPSTAVAGSPDKVINIYGSGFVSGSSVTSKGQAVVASYVSGSQLTATIPANHLANPGPVPIIVTNPAPGGGPSAAVNLTVGCDTTGVTYALSTVGTTTTINTNFNNTGLMSRWQKADSCQVADFSTTSQQPGRYYVVQNTTGKTARLSAWADCSTITQGDAFLTFYRRPTVPANNTERYQCAFWVAEGTNGAGGYASPEAGGSMWCPGLTKDNGGDLQLMACEKAVVHIQPYDYTSSSYTPPPRIKVRLENP